jgi:hypothetical protein
MVVMSSLRAGRPLSPGRLVILISVSQPQDHIAAGRIRSIERSSDPIGNQTRDLPACNIVPQPTTLLLTPSLFIIDLRNTFCSCNMNVFHYVILNYIGSTLFHLEECSVIDNLLWSLFNVIIWYCNHRNVYLHWEESACFKMFYEALQDVT